MYFIFTFIMIFLFLYDTLFIWILYVVFLLFNNYLIVIYNYLMLFLQLNRLKLIEKDNLNENIKIMLCNNYEGMCVCTFP